MSFSSSAARLLACPYCTSPLRIGAVVEETPEGIEHGLMACDACGFDYPIVAGIVIIGGPNDRLDQREENSADLVIRGPRVVEVVEMMKAKDPVGALNRLLNPSALRGELFPDLEAFDRAARPKATRIIAHKLDQVLGRRYRGMRRLAKRAVARVALPRARARLGAYLAQRGSELAAVDVLDLYYRRYSGAEVSNYFVYRFGQPRHLAGLGLAARLNNSDGALLDLGCGVGHLTHYFTSTRPGRTVLGADRDFFRLFVAKRYVAPAANYVCLPADAALPFPASALAGIFCSDAFHLFLHRAMTVREMRRVLADRGLIIVARFGNAAVEPREGYELRVDGYRRLFAGLEHVVLGEEAMLQQYLQKRTPDLAHVESDAELEKQKWISVVASRTREAFTASEPFDSYPHAVGRLQLNPIYAIDGRSPAGDLDMHLEFPSEWYRFENQHYLKYAPEKVRVSGEVVRALEAREGHPELDELVRQCVVVGMPDRYQASGLGPQASGSGR
jgi:SAM-dependent methyltransferase/uncharacterized protein YbaR (Trm112 family)